MILSKISAAFFASTMMTFASALPLTVMPAPQMLGFRSGRLAITPQFGVSLSRHDNVRLRAGLARALRRVEERTGMAFARLPDGNYALSDTPSAALIVECVAPSLNVPALGEDESYTLEVDSTHAILQAPNDLGVLHGLETLLQLLQADSTGWFLPTVSIKDQPRFPWRGLLIDVARHWQPIEVIKRNLDGMALVKLNVLHLHLTDDQGFRIESKTYPRLHDLGSDGHYFTQDQMRELIAYAADRGIRVVPEFDVPGHATSWLVGYPELASASGPYTIGRKRGVYDSVLDPTNPKLYEVLDGFLGEMATLFPDPYFHIGGDENNGVQWNANPRIQAFIRQHNLIDNAGLHAYLNTRLHAILAKHGKRLVGWEEVMHPDLPNDSIVHSWRGKRSLVEAAQHGYASILSSGYYIDLIHPAKGHYLNDPISPDLSLTLGQQKLILGGEATMWTTWETPETIDSRIWPRTAAIAERFWSPSEVRDVADMYRRLGLVSRRLEEAGLQHESYLEPALRRLAGDHAAPADLAALRTLVDLLEPVKDYNRGRLYPQMDMLSPLTGFVDCTRPDSAVARAFASEVETAVYAPSPTAENLSLLTQQLTDWKSAASLLAARLGFLSPRLQEAAPMFRAVIAASDIGLEAKRLLAAKTVPATGWRQIQFAELEQAALPHAGTELPIISSLKFLVAAAAEQDRREKLLDELWKQHLISIAAPSAKLNTP